MNAAATEPLIRLRGIGRRYGEGEAAVHALRGVGIDIERGEFVAVMGASGSGKSTMMNIIGCLDSPSEGEYRFSGVPVQGMTRDERALLRRHQIGFVFQGFNLLARTTARENVELPLTYLGWPAARRREAAMRALALVGLVEREHHMPNELSGGQQQRVAIARALVTEPTLLLADEPTGNLDSQRGLEIMELLGTLNRERGITIVMVTHEPQMAAHANRTIRFADGRVVAPCGGSDERSAAPMNRAHR